MLAVGLSALFLDAPYTAADTVGLFLVLAGLAVALWRSNTG
jgi:drug/metabolite transporter (DMT)-like permease